MFLVIFSRLTFSSVENCNTVQVWLIPIAYERVGVQVKL